MWETRICLWSSGKLNAVPDNVGDKASNFENKNLFILILHDVPDNVAFQHLSYMHDVVYDNVGDKDLSMILILHAVIDNVGDKDLSMILISTTCSVW